MSKQSKREKRQQKHMDRLRGLSCEDRESFGSLREKLYGKLSATIDRVEDVQSRLQLILDADASCSTTAGFDLSCRAHEIVSASEKQLRDVEKVLRRIQSDGVFKLLKTFKAEVES